MKQIIEENVGSNHNCLALELAATKESTIINMSISNDVANIAVKIIPQKQKRKWYIDEALCNVEKWWRIVSAFL